VSRRGARCTKQKLSTQQGQIELNDRVMSVRAPRKGVSMNHINVSRSAMTFGTLVERQINSACGRGLRCPQGQLQANDAAHTDPAADTDRATQQFGHERIDDMQAQT